MLDLSSSSKNLSIFFRSRTNHKLFHHQSRCISSNTPVPTHEQISHLILDQKSPTEALQTFRWASKLPHFTHTQSTYRALVHKLCTFRRFDTAHQLLDEMPTSIGLPPDDDIFVTIVRGLGRARMIRQVVKVPNLVSRFKVTPTVKIYNSILNVLVKEDIDIARGFYRRKMMGCGVKGDMYTYGILMKGLCLTNRISDGFKLLQTMKNKGVTPNTVIYNTLLHALCKTGKLGIGRARSLMNEMVEPKDVTFNILITAYCKAENIVQALVMLEKSFDLGFVPDVITLTKVIKVLCDKDRAMEAVEVLERVEKKGGEIDVVVYNTLIKGFCKLKKVKAAVRFLKEMEMKGCLPNAETYNVLIFGFCELGLLDSAVDMFDEMKTVGIAWNLMTYDTLIGGLFSRGRIEDGYKIMEIMVEKGNVPDYVLWNSVVQSLARESTWLGNENSCIVDDMLEWILET
ncbi:putative tetratricopeptide-like helical domain superfamily [Helianthus annuus]|nr:putative tetratricopeptide-like helical domain superfamily [Helianthus annuus]